MAEVIVGLSQLDGRLNALTNIGSREGMGQLGESAVREQKLLVHRKTGFTGRSIGLDEVSNTGFTTIASGAAPFLEFGTRAHIIKPVKAKVLAWASGPAGGSGRRLSGATRKGYSGPMSFAKIVHHPGTRPYPFMLPGLEKVVTRLGDFIVSAWNSAR